MRHLALAATAAGLAALAASAGHASRETAQACVPRELSSAYTSSVQAAAASNRDVWGEQLLGARGGPTLAAARRYLTPLTGALQWEAHRLTASGSYYLPFAFPFTAHDPGVFALHVADGSAIVTRRFDGPSLTLYVGSGSERYGSCAARLRPARLAGGYLPSLQTEYNDANGVRYRQESFAGRALGARSIVSFVRLVVDARHANGGSTVLLATKDGGNRLIVSRGATPVRGGFRFRVRAGSERTIYADWLHAPPAAHYLHANAATYANARTRVVRFWHAKLAGGATFDVPEPAVRNAARGILTQLIAYGWRYSIGNPYEELSYAESLDAAEVAAELGFPAVARSIIDLSLQRMRIRPWRFTAFRGAHILSTAALYYRLTHGRAFLRARTPALAQLVQRIAGRQEPSGLLHPEPLSTDLEDRDVPSVSGQVEAVEGLLAIGRVWGGAGDAALAARARALALSIERPLRRELARAITRLPDGSVFVPDQLPQAPFQRLTATRAGSYWNLVMPYAFASGWFAPRTPTAQGILRYLSLHGARLLGVPRTYARTVYGTPGAGLAQVYALAASRFLADNDRPDRLVLSLYGMLAAGMTADTYVSGEAVSVLPLRGAYARSMFMPPNTGANASYLGTLRELLVHERAGGLDLAFSTPRAWLASGKRIVVRGAPTSFGKVSFTLARHGDRIDGTLVLHAHTRLRLRLPAGERLAQVRVGRSSVRPDARGTIDLGDRRGTVTVHATVA